MTQDQLFANIRRKGSYLCVGLDPDLNRLPRHLLDTDDPVFEFCRAIVDSTAPYCVAYKPNLAFFEALGARGWLTLEKIVRYIRATDPSQFVIADAKRGDIGNTSRLYARSFFEHLDVDAVTVAPYMGHDSVTPFLGYDGKWVILLALTSNPGSADFQLVPDADGRPLYERVITTARTWADTESLMFVVGATRADMFTEVRRLAPDSFLLVPGVGAQGGSLEEVSRLGMTDRCGLLVNSSRGIIFASAGADFAEAASIAARRMRDEMETLLADRGLL